VGLLSPNPRQAVHHGREVVHGLGRKHSKRQQSLYSPIGLLLIQSRCPLFLLSCW
jgi:hypothetical protein